MTSTKRRFGFMLLFFKVGGFPLTTKKLPLLQYAYNLIITIAFYSVYFACIYHGYMNIEELKNGMTTFCQILTLTITVITDMNYRFQMKTLKRLFCVIESFTWENMPLIDEETGKMTMAEWIPRIEKFVKRSLSFALALHIVQASVRVTTTDEMIYNTMYPFDILQSPVYEIILMTQISEKTGRYDDQASGWNLVPFPIYTVHGCVRRYSELGQYKRTIESYAYIFGDNSDWIHLLLVWKCVIRRVRGREQCCLGLRLGWSSCAFSEMRFVYHKYFKTRIYADGCKVCTGLQFYTNEHDKRVCVLVYVFADYERQK